MSRDGRDLREGQDLRAVPAPRDGTPLDRKLAALGTATDLGEGRLPDQALAAARQVVDHAGQRRRLSAEHTVVGFFGATGSGKSSLFNAVTCHPLARAAATRPTTSEPMAAVWGAEGAGPLLDWLEVSQRHVLDGPAAGTDLTTWWGRRRELLFFAPLWALWPSAGAGCFSCLGCCLG